MNPLAVMGVALGIGWVVVWYLMNRQVKRQSELEKKVEALEGRGKKEKEREREKEIDVT